MLDQHNVMITGKAGNGKSTALHILIVNRVERINQLQALVIVPTLEAGFMTKAALDRLGGSNPLATDIVFYGHLPAVSSQVLIGTPLELAKYCQNGTINTTALKLVCFDDADYTSQYKDVQALFSINCQFVFCASVHLFKPPTNMLNIEIFNEFPTWTTMKMRMPNKVKHTFAVASSARVKIDQVSKAIENGVTMLFCGVRIKLFVQYFLAHMKLFFSK